MQSLGPIRPTHVLSGAQAQRPPVRETEVRFAFPSESVQLSKGNPLPATAAPALLAALAGHPAPSLLGDVLQASIDRLRGAIGSAPRHRPDPVSVRPRAHPPESFPYSPENPPALDVLKERMFLVHATPLLPGDGVLHAGARDVSSGTTSIAREPASFRPTLHWSQGEVVRGHGGHTWDEHPFAVVAPLQAVLPQLVNVYPHDTYILGDYRLDERSTLVVPAGTPRDRLPVGVAVVEYPKDKTLRQAVDEVVADRGGWSVRMRDGDVGTGAEARIGGTEINDPRFFASLFEAHPHVSYGTHLGPERGEAFRFGNVEQSAVTLMRSYHSYGLGLGTDELRFYRAFVDHNLERLDATITEPGRFSPQSLDAYRQKKTRLRAWMNIVDEDVALRLKWGRTLARPSERMERWQEGLRAHPAALHLLAMGALPFLPAAKSEPVSPGVAAEALSCLSPAEMREFAARIPDVMGRMDQPRMLVEYAMSRWLVIGTERARSEGLDRMLGDSLAAMPQTAAPRLDPLEDALRTSSNRLETALEILRHPALVQRLNGPGGFSLPPEGPRTLEDLRRADPEAREPAPESLGLEDLPAELLLRRLGKRHDPRHGPAEARESWRVARDRHWWIEDERESAAEYREALRTLPMSSVRNDDDLPGGERLSIYEMLRRDVGARGIFQKLGLEEAFGRRFPDEDAFWSSDLTLLQIVAELSGSP